MPDPGARSSIRRILVALDASADSLAGLEAAAQLAAEREAEIAGLFVEETDLLRVGRLPGTREIPLFAEEPRALEAGDLERQLRGQARTARDALRSVAERLEVRWSFRTARGEVAAELAEAGAGADLLAVGATGRSLARPPGSTVRALLERAGPPVLVLRQGARLGRVIHVLHDGTDAAWEAVRTAAELGRREGGRLDVLLAVQDADEARELRERTERQLRQSGLPTRYRHLPRDDVGRLCSALREGPGVLVAPAPRFRGRAGSLGRLLRAAGRPVVLVGPGKD